MRAGATARHWDRIYATAEHVALAQRGFTDNTVIDLSLEAINAGINRHGADPITSGAIQALICVGLRTTARDSMPRA